MAIASVVMSLTKTIHPPAGATCLLAATSTDITNLGWYLPPFILLGSTLMLASACLIDNLYRQFPVYWWTPVNLRNELHRKLSTSIAKLPEVEKAEEEDARLSFTLSRTKTKEEIHLDREHEIKITTDKIIIPSWLDVSDWERSVLEIIRERLKEGAGEGFEWTDPTTREQSRSGLSLARTLSRAISPKTRR